MGNANASGITLDEFKDQVLGTTLLLLAPRLDGSLTFDESTTTEHVLPPSLNNELQSGCVKYYDSGSRELRNDQIENYINTCILDSTEHVDAFYAMLIRQLNARHSVTEDRVSVMNDTRSVKAQSQVPQAQSQVPQAQVESQVESQVPQAQVESQVPQAQVQSQLPQTQVQSQLPQAQVQSQVQQSQVQSQVQQSQVQSQVQQSQVQSHQSRTSKKLSNKINQLNNEISHQRMIFQNSKQSIDRESVDTVEDIDDETSTNGVAPNSVQVAVTPEPFAVTPEPVALTPEPVAVTPEPVAVTPEPVAVTPEPQ
jgi:hypothetical protein